MAQVPFNAQTLIFDIPAGNSHNVFMDPKETQLSFRLTWVVTTASSATSPLLQLIRQGLHSLIHLFFIIITILLKPFQIMMFYTICF